MLLVADFHLGKAHSFRRWGVPVPGGTTQQNLARLGALIDEWQAEEVVFLGDFLHSARARTGPGVAAFATWRAARPALRLTLVRGNHDEHAGDPPDEAGLQVVDEPHACGPFALSHHPKRLAGTHVVAGHWHPAAVVGGTGFDRLRLPAFHLHQDVLVLPAFGEFTGLKVITRQAGDQCFVTDGVQVLRLP